MNVTHIHTAKQAIKSAIGQAIFTSRLSEVLLRSAALVVAFHRVQNAATPGDDLTVSADMFERHCRFFKRYFDVVPLRDIVSRLERGLPVDGRLAITFDDGYRDNFEKAAPILERLSLPATFFVVSQWIESDVVPWWDEERRVRHPWMTWDEVRSLRQRGFDIGAHTRTHVDLGKVGVDAAREEIVGARRELEARIGAPVDVFAYPYGRRDNINDVNLALIRSAGFRCCCSCFGGIVGSGADPFHLPRVPISPWYASPSELGVQVALGRSNLSA